MSEGEYIIKINLGWQYSAALSSDGRVFTWGYFGYGQLGNGIEADYAYTPIDITGNFNLSEGETIIELFSRDHHSIAITSLGRVVAWGDNDFGQLGIQSITDSYYPVEITERFGFLPEETITAAPPSLQAMGIPLWTASSQEISPQRALGPI